MKGDWLIVAGGVGGGRGEGWDTLGGGESVGKKGRERILGDEEGGGFVGEQDRDREGEEDAGGGEGAGLTYVRRRKEGTRSGCGWADGCG